MAAWSTIIFPSHSAMVRAILATESRPRAVSGPRSRILDALSVVWEHACKEGGWFRHRVIRSFQSGTVVSIWVDQSSAGFRRTFRSNRSSRGMPMACQYRCFSRSLQVQAYPGSPVAAQGQGFMAACTRRSGLSSISVRTASNAVFCRDGNSSRTNLPPATREKTWCSSRYVADMELRTQKSTVSARKAADSERRKVFPQPGGPTSSRCRRPARDSRRARFAVSIPWTCRRGYCPLRVPG